MVYIGNSSAANFASVTKDTFSGNGSTTAFTLSKPATTNGVAVYVENVRQIPTTAYTVSGTTLDFGSGNAPVSGTNNIYVLHHNAVASTANHPASQDLTAVAGTFTSDVAIDGAVTINESGASKDFRVETDGKTHAFFIDGSANNIAMGTTTPTFATGNGLHLGDDFHIGFGDGNGTRPDFQLGYDATNTRLALKAGTASDDTDFLFTTGGNFLIGTTTAAIDGSSGEGLCFRFGAASLITVIDDEVFTLNRRGSDGIIQRFRNDGVSVGTISVDGNSLPSDRNFKKNISNLNLGLDLVTKLQPSQYNYKIQSDDAPKLYGLIAQDLEQALIDCGVAKNSTSMLQYKEEDEKESDYSLDYAKLVPILINCIKELDTKVKALENK